MRPKRYDVSRQELSSKGELTRQTCLHWGNVQSVHVSALASSMYTGVCGHWHSIRCKNMGVRFRTGVSRVNVWILWVHNLCMVRRLSSGSGMNCNRTQALSSKPSRAEEESCSHRAYVHAMREASA